MLLRFRKIHGAGEETVLGTYQGFNKKSAKSAYND